MKRNAFVIAVLLAGLGWVSGRAQTQAPARNLVLPRSVEAAEAEGAKWPSNPPQADRTSWADAFGPRDRRCVRAADHTTMRSGDFIAGPFKDRVLMVGTGGQPPKWKVWWVPNQMPPLNGNVQLMLRATKMNQPEKTVTHTFVDIANEHAEEPFFPTTVLFPENGDWLVVATAGNNWGCFIIEETRSAMPR